MPFRNLLFFSHKDEFKDFKSSDSTMYNMDTILKPFGFLCINCKTRVCSLPMDCPSCGLRLVSATQIAKAQMHIMPLPVYTEMQVDKAMFVFPSFFSLFFDTNLPCFFSKCFSCNVGITMDEKFYECRFCQEKFCDECDSSNHQSMICSGCSEPHSKNTPSNGTSHSNGISNGTHR